MSRVTVGSIYDWSSEAKYDWQEKDHGGLGIYDWAETEPAVTFVFSPPSNASSFWTGVGTVLDLGGNLNGLLSWQDRLSDATALHCDWAAVGVDFRRAARRLRSTIETDAESAPGGQQSLFDPVDTAHERT